MPADNSIRPAKKGPSPIFAIILVIIALAALGYSLSHTGLFTPNSASEAAEAPTTHGPAQVDLEKLPPVDFEELHSRIRKPENLQYVKSVENACLAEYDRQNPAASAWHTEGRVAARLFAFVVAYGDFYGEGLGDLANKYAKNARKAGCRDPLMPAICDVMNYESSHSVTNADANRHLSEVSAFTKSNYPVICQLVATLSAVGNLQKVENSKDLREDMSAITARTPEFVELALGTFGKFVQSAPPNRALSGQTSNLLDLVDDDSKRLTEVGQRVISLFDQAKVPGAVRCYTEGDLLINLAWAARGTGWANTVTDTGWKIMAQRLSEARTVLTAGSTSFPGDPNIPTLMLTVELGEPTDKAAMESWFQKATAIEPNQTSAYRSKMYYLQPRWHGSPQEVVDFGRKCVETGRWDACIPMVLVDAFDTMSGQYETMFSNPEIWKLYSDTCEEFLRRYPKSITCRTKYFRAAVKGQHWKTAREQLKMLESGWDRGVCNVGRFNKLKAAIPAES